MKIAVQLYTLRDLTAADFAGTMAQVADIGYAGVELAGYGNMTSAKAAKAALDAAGLQVCGMHVPIDTVANKPQQAIDDALALQCPWIVVPYVGKEYRTLDGYTKLARQMEKFAETARGQNLGVAYHNHDFEFQNLGDGQTGIDIIYNEADPELIFAELDLYWVARGGSDPVSYMQKLSDRLPLIHLKDMDSADETKFAPVGTGRLDFTGILKAANSMGVSWGIVEQDNCYSTPPLESIRTSYQNLARLGATS